MSNKKKLYLIVFSIIPLICFGVLIFSLILTRDTRRMEASGGVKKQELSVKNLVLVETKEGSVYWELYATKGTYDSEAGSAVLTKPTGNFYDKDSKVVLSFESDLGTYFQNTKKMILEGNVFVVAYDGSSIKADEISFKGKDEDIVAKGNVVVRRNQDFISKADNARFNSELTFFEISGNTETDVYSKDGSKPQKLIN